MDRIALTIALAAATLIVGCKKEEETPFTPVSNPIVSKCIGVWRADSSYVPSTGSYNQHAQATFDFSNEGSLAVTWPDGSADTYIFWIGEESSAVTSTEIGRALIWFKEPSDGPDESDGILMVFQGPEECFLLLSDDIGETSPWNTLAIVQEDLVTMGDPVFDFWAKCYRQ